MRPVFLTAEWRYVVLLNFEVDPAFLEPLVPAGTRLDRFRGAALASVVGFRFLRTRVLGLPIPFHRDFDEVNLRFYVVRDAADGPRRGVVFVREIVPRRAIALVARGLYGENYVAAPMRHTVDLADRRTSSGAAAYEWRADGQWCGVEAAVEGAPRPLEPGSEAEFIAEHYRGYTRRRDGSTLEYRVEHPPWRVWRATRASLTGGAADYYGPEWAPFLSATPRSAFVAVGSPVRVRTGRRLPDGRTPQEA